MALLTLNMMLFSGMFLALVVEGAPTAQIVPRHEAGDAARAETGTVGRLVYGIVSTVCLCAMSFAMGKILKPNFRCNITLTYNRPSCDTIRKEEKAAIRLVAFPHSNRGGHDARHLRRDPGVWPQSHHVQGMPGINHSLPLLVLLFQDPAVSSPQVNSCSTISSTKSWQLHILPGKNPHRPLASRHGAQTRPHLARRHGNHHRLLRRHGSLVHCHAARRYQYGRRPLPNRE